MSIEGYYGFDVIYEVMPGADEPTVISNDPSESDPNRGFPLMGYLSPKYIDAYHWCMTLQIMGVDCDPLVTPLQASLGGRAMARVAPRRLSAESSLESFSYAPGGIHLQVEPFLIVGGVVQKEPLQASIDQAMTLPESPSDLDSPAHSDVDTGFELAVLDADGQVLSAAPILENTVNHELLNAIPFLIGLPLPPGAEQVVIRRQGQVLAMREFSPNLPAVQVLSPNGGEVYDAPFEIVWQGSDPDGDTLNYTLQYSPDGGTTWQVMAMGLTGDRYQVLSLYNLTGSDLAKIRVLANDGANTAVDESDGVFSVPNTPPLPAIQAPGHLEVFPAGARVPLSGIGHRPRRRRAFAAVADLGIKRGRVPRHRRQAGTIRPIARLPRPDADSRGRPGPGCSGARRHHDRRVAGALHPRRGRAGVGQPDPGSRAGVVRCLESVSRVPHRIGRRGRDCRLGADPDAAACAELDPPLDTYRCFCHADRRPKPARYNAPPRPPSAAADVFPATSAPACFRGTVASGGKCRRRKPRLGFSRR
jgi:hypothetical protein